MRCTIGPAKNHLEADKAPVLDAGVYGGRQALRWTAAIPAAMAVGYLLLVLYFRMRGGYKAVHLDSSGREFEVGHDPNHDADETLNVAAAGPKHA